MPKSSRSRTRRRQRPWTSARSTRVGSSLPPRRLLFSQRQRQRRPARTRTTSRIVLAETRTTEAIAKVVKINVPINRRARAATINAAIRHMVVGARAKTRRIRKGTATADRALTQIIIITRTEADREATTTTGRVATMEITTSKTSRLTRRP